MQLEFEGGTKKDINLEPFLHGPIFEDIRRDRKEFIKVRVEGGLSPGPMELISILMSRIMT